jgi:hypothetical protein
MVRTSMCLEEFHAADPDERSPARSPTDCSGKGFAPGPPDEQKGTSVAAYLRTRRATTAESTGSAASAGNTASPEKGFPCVLAG